MTTEIIHIELTDEEREFLGSRLGWPVYQTEDGSYKYIMPQEAAKNRVIGVVLTDAKRLPDGTYEAVVVRTGAMLFADAPDKPYYK